MTTIRVATEADAEEILAIYAKYIEQTAITFEYVVPSIEEFRGRIRHTLERFPYLAAEKDGKIAGYAYVSPFKERAAYDWSVETSIYVDMEQKRSGIGRRLYEELENILKQQGILNVNACTFNQKFILSISTGQQYRHPILLPIFLFSGNQFFSFHIIIIEDEIHISPFYNIIPILFFI